MTYQQTMKEVRARVAASRSSFAAGMAVLPKARRDAMYALYAFCREVDDIADNGATKESRQNGLQEWRERIRALFQAKEHPSLLSAEALAKADAGGSKSLGDFGEGLKETPSPAKTKDLLAQAQVFASSPSRGEENFGSDSITLALSPALKEFSLVEDDFQAIIDGMAMDAGEPICAPSIATLDLYCDRVASAVGRASVRIFGDASENGLRVAHHLGRALQLTNILRDLAEDAERGRLYLPEELLAKHGIATCNPSEVVRHPNLALVCRNLAKQAQQHFAGADAAMRLCLPKAMRPARIMRAYYGALLDRLIAEGWRDPFTRVRLTRWQKLWLAVKAFF